MECRVTPFFFPMYYVTNPHRSPLPVHRGHDTNRSQLSRCGADPSCLGMSASCKWKRQPAYLPNQVEYLCQFSNNCGGGACSSATLHPSAPETHVCFMFLHAFLECSPFLNTFTCSPFRSLTIRSHIARMCSPKEASNCSQVGAFPARLHMLGVGCECHSCIQPCYLCEATVPK